MLTPGGVFVTISPDHPPTQVLFLVIIAPLPSGPEVSLEVRRIFLKREAGEDILELLQPQKFSNQNIQLDLIGADGE